MSSDSSRVAAKCTNKSAGKRSYFVKNRACRYRDAGTRRRNDDPSATACVSLAEIIIIIKAALIVVLVKVIRCVETWNELPEAAGPRMLLSTPATSRTPRKREDDEPTGCKEKQPERKSIQLRKCSSLYVKDARAHERKKRKDHRKSLTTQDISCIINNYMHATVCADGRMYVLETSAFLSVHVMHIQYPYSRQIRLHFVLPLIFHS